MFGTQYYFVEKPATSEQKTFRSPAVDIIEKEDSFVILVNLPGVKKEDLKVSIDNRELSIEGKTTVSNDESIKYILRERKVSDFRRKFNLGDSINEEKIEAVHENGVLTLTLSKKDEIQPKNITIK